MIAWPRRHSRPATTPPSIRTPPLTRGVLGLVLGLFVENEDSTSHSFDIDSLGIHVAVPAGATVAVAIKPTKAGSIEFYCAIPGHKEAGMAGTIQVQ